MGFSALARLSEEMRTGYHFVDLQSGGKDRYTFSSFITWSLFGCKCQRVHSVIYCHIASNSVRGTERDRASRTPGAQFPPVLVRVVEWPWAPESRGLGSKS